MFSLIEIGMLREISIPHHPCKAVSNAGKAGASHLAAFRSEHTYTQELNSAMHSSGMWQVLTCTI